MPKRNRWIYVALPKFLMDQIDMVIESDRYPEGRWRSRIDVAVEALKRFLEQPEVKAKLEAYKQRQTKAK